MDYVKDLQLGLGTSLVALIGRYLKAELGVEVIDRVNDEYDGWIRIYHPDHMEPDNYLLAFDLSMVGSPLIRSLLDKRKAA